MTACRRWMCLYQLHDACLMAFSTTKIDRLCPSRGNKITNSWEGVSGGANIEYLAALLVGTTTVGGACTDSQEAVNGNQDALRSLLG